MRVDRQPIAATYDIRDSGPRYHVTTRVSSRTVSFQRPVDDPFGRTTVTVGWRDALRSLLRHGHVEVTVITGGDRDIAEDVLELNYDYRGRPGSSRHAGFASGIQSALSRLGRDPGE